MKIPWWLEVIISFIMILIMNRKSYKDGYMDGYIKAVRDTGDVINAVCKFKDSEKQ